MYTTTLTSALALLTLSNAYPTTTTNTTTTYHSPSSNLTSRTGSALTAVRLLSVAPKSRSCSAAKQPLECRTATQALGPIQNSFKTYGIADPATQAAVLSTIALESGDFQYAMHYFPKADHPGQGTRNMQGKEFNDKYADSLMGLPKEKLAEARASEDGNAVVKLLMQYPDYDFGSAAWFLVMQCERSVVEGLKTPGEKGFAAYLGCMGTEASKDRTMKYQAALDAYGVRASAA